MGRGQAQFIGASGQYYLAYGLAVRQINASLTIGNAPSVDVITSSQDGRRSLAFQVKTSRNAYRKNHYGSEGYEWDVGASVIGKYWESFWYAFIDLQENSEGWNPRVFFVPSQWVAKFVKPNFSRKLYFLPTTAQYLTFDRWDLVKNYLAEDTDAIDWANNWPEEILCKWGE